MAFHPIPPEALRVGEPTLFALRDKSGFLLMPRGTVLGTESQRLQWLERELYVDEQDSERLRRAMAGKVDHLLRRNVVLGQIAQARPDAADVAAANGRGDAPRRLADPLNEWAGLQMRASALLRDAAQADFLPRLTALQEALLEKLDSEPDDALLLLVHRAAHEFQDYSALHALLVTVVCELAARGIAGWEPAWRDALRGAALTMNIGMTGLQNILAAQDTPPSPPQRARLAAHAEAGAAALQGAGVTDPMWLDAVRLHHGAEPGPLAGRTPGAQLARLLQRADLFAARLSPRKHRSALSATAAAKAAYLDERQQPDEAGSALLKATGLYPPGSFVKLRNGETAVVLRRGLRANAPLVVSITNPNGLALAEPVLRQTRVAAFEVAAGLPPQDVKVRLNLERLLRLV